jgi:hypothetical protein
MKYLSVSQYNVVMELFLSFAIACIWKINVFQQSLFILIQCFFYRFSFLTSCNFLLHGRGGEEKAMYGEDAFC